MKKTSLLLLFALMGLSTLLYASKWRVNNIPGIDADFTTAQVVNDTSLVLPGDTVYFEGSETSYGNLILSKRLVMIGPGYFLGENDSTQAKLSPATLGTVILNPGAENSVVTGLTTGSFYLRCGNILLKRDHIGDIYVGDAGAVSNEMFLQCWIYYAWIYTGCQNVMFMNNVFSMADAWQWAFYMYDNTSGSFLNNITNCRCRFNDCEVRNNINVPPGGSTRETWDLIGSCINTNNIAASESIGTENGNQTNVDMSTVFMYTGSSDGQYKLKPGSPAIGTGYEGVDCGIYGGSQPYVLSGLPTLPAIWELNVNGNTVTMKAKSH